MRLLLITFDFPPSASIAALRPYYLAKHLQSEGFEVWVLTVDERNIDRIDLSAKLDGISADRIIRTAVASSRRDIVKRVKQCLSGMLWYRHTQSSADRLSEDCQKKQAKDNLSLWRRWLIACMLYPDWHIGWYHPALRQARRIIEDNQIDVIVSTSPPRVAHLVARDLARQYRLRWVMDMRDPWSYGWHGTAHDLFPFTSLIERLFISCMKSANLITVNTDALYRQYIDSYRQYAYKMTVLPNGVGDDLLGLNTEYAAQNELAIGHFGGLYGHRTVSFFLAGFKAWLDRHPDCRGRLRVRFWGRVENAEVLHCVRELGLQDVVHVEDVLPRAQAWEHMRRCYALLLVATGQPLQIPGKTYEYLAMQRRIIALTEPDSATAELLSREPYCYIADDAGKAYAAMEACWRDYTSEAPALVRREEILNRYSYTRLATQLARLIRRL